MGTITAKSLIARVSRLMFDPTNVQWTIPEHLESLNDGQREIALQLPSASTKNQALQLAPGTVQSIPSDGIQFLKGLRNMGTAGTTIGKAIRPVDMDTMDHESPDWHTATAAAVVVHYMFDPNDPRRFYVTPPQPSPAHWMQIVYSCAPTVITDINSVISLDDVYANALVDYMQYRAWSKGSKDIDIPKAQAAWGQFVNSLGLKKESDQMLTPGLNPMAAPA